MLRFLNIIFSVKNNFMSEHVSWQYFMLNNWLLINVFVNSEAANWTVFDQMLQKYVEKNVKDTHTEKHGSPWFICIMSTATNHQT